MVSFCLGDTLGGVGFGLGVVISGSGDFLGDDRGDAVLRGEECGDVGFRGDCMGDDGLLPSEALLDLF